MAKSSAASRHSDRIQETDIVMNFKMNNTALATLVAFGIAIAGYAAPNFASAQTAATPPQGWFKQCNKQDDNDICVVQFIMTAPSGQLITAVGLITVQGKVNRKMIQVTVPPARLIPPGVLMQVDGAKGQKLDYAVCMPDKCIAELPLTDAMIASLKKGGELVMTSVNFQRTPNPIKFSLNGFTGVFDGPAMEQSKLEERQRLLQEEMQKKAEEARKKLEDAQKAATQQ